jgi:4-hydroxy-2-oxoheptanedioate aldolase
MYLKERLVAGHPVIGALIYSNSPEVIEYAAVGMDWIWWEGQHTHASWERMIHGVRTAHWMGIPVLVRTWTHDGGTIERLLDTGAEGIIVPMVDTPEQAEEILSHCYYPPTGNRSYGSVRMERIERDLNEWNRRIVIVMMIETPKALQNAEAIADLPGVDGLYVGMRDLAFRLGKDVDDYTAHLSVKDELDHVVQVCKKAGKAAAVLVSSPDELVSRVRDGYQLICAGADLNILKAGWRQMREVFEKVTPDIERQFSRQR